jgi:hypothetical protein
MQATKPPPPQRASLRIYTNPFTPVEAIVFIAIIMLAAVLRVGAAGIVEFKRDEANLSYMALDMARGREFPLLGIDSSVGIRNAPINVYIMVVPYLFSSDPTVATQYVGWLNVLGVALIYLMARRYGGPVAAIIAAVTFAVSPWGVVYSRKIWAQDMLPPFIIATVWTGILGFVEKKRWAQWFHLPLLAFTGQIHYVCFVLIPITLYLLVVGRKALTRAFWGSMFVTALVLLPFAIGIIREAQLHPTQIQRILSGETIIANPTKPKGIQLTADAAFFAWFTVNGNNLHAITGEQAFRDYLAQVPPTTGLFDVYGVVIVLAVVWLGVRTVRRRDARAPIDITLLLWVLITPVAFSVTWTTVYPHYMIPILPAAYLILGLAAADLQRSLRALLNREGQARSATVWYWAGMSVLVGALTVTLGFQLVWQTKLNEFVNTHNTPGGFGTPLGYLTPIRTAILKESPSQVIVNLDGQYIGYHDEATVWNFLLYDIPTRRYADAATELYPAEPAVYLTHQCNGEMANSTAQFTLRTEAEGCLAITTRTAADFPAAMFTPIPNADQQQFANGLRFTHYRWEPQTGCLVAVWTTTAGPVPEDYSTAVHFVDQQGNKILDADGLSYRGQLWRAGDRVARRFCLQYGQERIPEIRGVRLGLYTTTETPTGRQFNGVGLLDAQGQAIAAGMVSVQFP